MNKYINQRREYLKNSFFYNITDKEINKFLDFQYLTNSKKLNHQDFKHLSQVFNQKICPKLLFSKGDNKYNVLEMLLIMSDYTYNPITILKKQLPNFIYYRQGEEESSKFLVTYSLEDNLIIVSFRGTKTSNNTKKDIKFYRTETTIIDDDTKDDFFKWREEMRKSEALKDFTFPLEDDKEIEVHKGFQENTKDLYPHLKKVIMKILGMFDKSKLEKVNIIFTGHSLGGATAFIMSLYFAILFNKNKLNVKRNVVTYGSPPIGNKNFHLLYYYFQNNYYVRVANNRDYLCSIGTEGFYFTKKIRHINMLTKDVCILQDINEKNTNNETETQLIYIDTNSLVDKQVKKMKKSNPKIKPSYNKIYHSMFIFNKNSKLMFL